MPRLVYDSGQLHGYNERNVVQNRAQNAFDLRSSQWSTRHSQPQVVASLLQGGFQNGHRHQHVDLHAILVSTESQTQTTSKKKKTKLQQCSTLAARLFCVLGSSFTVPTIVP